MHGGDAVHGQMMVARAAPTPRAQSARACQDLWPLMMMPLLASAAKPLLSAPSRLHVEYLPSPAAGSVLPTPLLPLISTAHPRFSFVPGDTDLPVRAGTISAYRIIVTSWAATADGTAPVARGWDSGKVAANETVSIRCEQALAPDSAWLWSVRYWNGQQQASPPAHGRFFTGPISPADWGASWWLGSGQGEFRIRFASQGVRSAMLYAASPGGAVLSVNGAPVGEQTGVSSWMDFNRSVAYIGWDVTPPTSAQQLKGSRQELLLTIGRGFWAGPGVCRTRRRNANNLFQQCGDHAVARVLLSLTLADGSKLAATSAPNSSAVEIVGRPSRILMDDPYLGSTTDMASQDAEWSAPWPVPDSQKPLLAATGSASAGSPGGGGGGLAALQIPPVRSEAVAPTNVTSLGGGRFAYKFSTNIVGFINIHDGSYSVRASGDKAGPVDCGNLTVTFCEVWNASTGNCSTQQGYNSNQGHAGQWKVGEQDTFMLRSGGSGALVPKFTWRGFMYAIVTASEGVAFSGALQDIHGVSISPGIERTGHIRFSGPGAGTLSQLDAMVRRTQSANFVGYYPSDCPVRAATACRCLSCLSAAANLTGIHLPTQSLLLSRPRLCYIAMTLCMQTREKLGWLGDAMETAREAMFNFWTAPIHEHFVHIVRSMQGACARNSSWSTWSSHYAGCDPAYRDFVPVVVPAGFISDYNSGENPGPQDLSWTAAFPLITAWLHTFYADEGIVRELYGSLKRWTNAQIAVSQNLSMPMPQFWKFGDHSALAEMYQHHGTDPEGTVPVYPFQSAEVTGPGSAAANFLLALDAMRQLASVVGLEQDVANYTATLETMRRTYDAQFWNASTQSYSPCALNMQTLTSLALAAKVPSEKRRAVAVASLVSNIAARDNHVTVGSTGAPVLLQQLSENGEHDVALRLALEESWPSWGFWLHGNETLGVSGGTCWESWLGDDTHNHIFLCGGLGEWLYSALAGIVPVGPGFSQLRIAPRISRTEGPSSVNASVQTVRGVVRSHWVRGDLTASGLIVQLAVTVPVGATAEVTLPLLGMAASEVDVYEGCDDERNRCSAGRVWRAGATDDTDVVGVDGVSAAVGPDGDEALVARVGAGTYSFVAMLARM